MIAFAKRYTLIVDSDFVRILLAIWGQLYYESKEEKNTDSFQCETEVVDMSSNKCAILCAGFGYEYYQWVSIAEPIDLPCCVRKAPGLSGYLPLF